MLTELDLQGCAAPPCDVDLVAGSEVPLARVLGWTGSAHPVQPIAAEWCAPLVWSAAWSDAWQEHGGRAVHAWHHVVFHRELLLPLHCRLSAEVVAQRPTRAGALTVVRYAAVAQDGPVWTTHAGVLWRGATTQPRGALSEPDLDDPGPSTLAVPKELIVTAGGKNIAPVAFEAALKEHPLVGHSCLVGDRRPYLTALVVLDPDEVARRAPQGPAECDPEILAELEALVAACNERCARSEQVKRYAVLGQDWTPAGGELTPTLKLRRSEIHQMYAAVIDGLYR